MAEATEQSAEADADSEEREQFPWNQQTPTTRLVGTPVDIIYGGQLGDDVKQNDQSYAVVLEDPEVAIGTLFRNAEKPGDDTVQNVVDEDSTSPTDYRIADPDDKDATFDQNGAFKTDEEATVDGEFVNTYEEADGFDEDRILVWYNGLSGQRIGRTLDFNGQPFARWTDGDDPYLIKGLLQATDEWRNQPGNRGKLASQGDAPRTARLPVLRDRVSYERNDDGEIQSAELLDGVDERRTAFEIRRPPEGRGYRAYVFDAEALAEEEGSIDAELGEDVLETLNDYEQNYEPRIDLVYSPRADTILDQAGINMSMYTGDGWPDEPAEWQPSSTSEVGSFGIGTSGADEDGLGAEEEQFVTEVADEIAGSGLTPEEAFNGGLEGLVGRYQDQFTSAPDVDSIRESVYGRVEHLDPDTLE